MTLRPPFIRGRIGRCFLALVALSLVALPKAAFACAACFGASDAPMAKGMNWGIFSLLGVIVTVLVGVASFFVYLARKSASTARPAASSHPGFAASAAPAK